MVLEHALSSWTITTMLTSQLLLQSETSLFAIGCILPMTASMIQPPVQQMVQVLRLPGVRQDI